MFVCILGMHRSGTSMVTRMLNLCGLHLGGAEDLMPPHAHDNAAGYWENMRFVDLNDKILAQLGGRWDEPPQPSPAWWKQRAFDPLREQAITIIEDLEGSAPWGWKDPRTCLTLPFWLDLLPDLTLVCCLRNPLDVMLSLGLRTNEPLCSNAALSLWTTYYERLQQTLYPSHLIVTHYAAYFYDPRPELQRVLDALGLATTDAALDAALATIQPELRHIFNDSLDLADTDLPPSTFTLYATLSQQSGPIYERMLSDETYWVDQLEIGHQKHYLQLATVSDLAIQAQKARDILQAENKHLQQTIHHLSGEQTSLIAAHAQLASTIQRMEEGKRYLAETPKQFENQVASLRETLHRLETQQILLVESVSHLASLYTEREAEQQRLATSVGRLESEKALLEDKRAALTQTIAELEKQKALFKAKQTTWKTAQTTFVESIEQLEDEKSRLSEELTALQDRLAASETEQATLIQTINQMAQEKGQLMTEKKGLLHTLITLATEKALCEVQRDQLHDEWQALQQSFIGRTVFQLQGWHLPELSDGQRRSPDRHTPLRIFLDAPSPESPVSRIAPLHVRGWAFSDSDPIQRIEVFLNDQSLGTVNHGLERRDVAQAFPKEAHALHSGFSQIFDVEDVAPGAYYLVVLATDKAGQAHALCQSLTLETPPTP